MREDRAWVLLLAGGSGRRMGAGENKVFLPLAGVPVIVRAIRACAGIADGLCVVVRAEDRARLDAVVARYGLADAVTRVADGGEDRQASVLNGLRAVQDDADIVLIHDGARPFASPDLFARVLASVCEHGSGLPALPVTDTVKRAENGVVVETLPRERLFAVQTPQGFLCDTLLRAHARAELDGVRATDDAALAERIGERVWLVAGEQGNVKLTTPEDMRVAEARIAAAEARHTAPTPLPAFRVGHGIDAHRYAAGRKLILCGETIPFEMGLLGHSDADVAVHALMDALLGAAGLGDIGRLFPDSDDAYLGASSMALLARVMDRLRAEGWRVVNADVTIVAQKPKLAPCMERMRRNLADALGVAPDCAHVKATTTEGMGPEGRLEGVSAQAVCLLERA